MTRNNLSKKASVQKITDCSTANIYHKLFTGILGPYKTTNSSDKILGYVQHRLKKPSFIRKHWHPEEEDLVSVNAVFVHVKFQPRRSEYLSNLNDFQQNTGIIRVTDTSTVNILKKIPVQMVG